MTDYTVLSDSTIDSDSILTQSTAFAWRDNPIAITEGAPGAPKVQAAALDTGAALANITANSIPEGRLASGAVDRSALKTTTASGSTSISGDGSQTVSLTGGTYSWWQAGVNNSTSASYIQAAFDNPTSSGSIRFVNTLGSSQTAQRYERYIQSSPPYDMGDGEVPLFIFVVIDNATGEIESIEVGQDPTWAYHGPTDLTPSRIDIKTGKKYKTVNIVADSGMTLPQVKAKNAGLFEEFKKGRVQLQAAEIEITPEFKNSDMDIASNPWFLNDDQIFAGKTRCLLNPFAEPMQRLYDLQSEIHAKEAQDIITEGAFIIDNEPMQLRCPQGIQMVNFRWKLT